MNLDAANLDPSKIGAGLKQYFGLNSFRKGQREILTSIMSGKDTLAVLPTGGGKSLCYQMPSALLDGPVLVISPLIALMKDQVRSLTELGLRAGAIYSGQSIEEKKQVFAQLAQSKQFVLFLSPERVQTEAFQTWFVSPAQKFKMIAIDEAHCISQWGPDFRDEYYKLSILRKLAPDIPILALTATATPRVLSDIAKSLSLRNPHKFVYGFYRNNIFIEVQETHSEDEKTLALELALNSTPDGRILVYCGTRKQSEELSAYFSRSHTGVGHYHAGLSPEERKRAQDELSNRNLRILFATNAFGMGIDYSDVRLVVHYAMPSNIESYYQEIGRAGRDGAKSKALIFYSKKDKGLQSYFIQNSDADASIKSRRWDALNTLVTFLEGGECRHSGILTYFKDKDRITDCGHCDVCKPEFKLPKPSTHTTYNSANFLSKKSARIVSNKSQKTLLDPSHNLVLDSESTQRLNKLKDWRRNFAKENDIPAFIVFSDKTLRDLAQKNPRSLSELQSVYGFGEKKVEWIGPQIVAELLLTT